MGAVVVTVPAVGTILSAALVVVPALAARLWTDRLGLTFVLAAAVGAGSGLVGLAAAATYDVAAGPAIALTVSVTFALAWATGAHGRRARRSARRRPDHGDLPGGQRRIVDRVEPAHDHR